jgi:hypothetical protein
MKYLSALLCVLLLAACQNKDAVRFRPLEANGVSVELPESLVPTKEDVDETALFDYEDLEQSVFCLAYRETKEDLAMQEDTFDLTGYLRYVASIFQDNMDGSTFAQATDENVHGLSARFGTVTGDLEEGGIFMRLGAYETPDAFYKLVIWCEQSDRARFEPVFDRVLRSFAVKQ